MDESILRGERYGILFNLCAGYPCGMWVAKECEVTCPITVILNTNDDIYKLFTFLVQL